ncbi:MAG: hypothetical protein CL608_16230 [Anaerolineaceae bacterium]|nr:hypothetical protein [Anaerolineaceae bacterium]
MNWKERFKPSNPAEAGCYFFIIIVAFHALLFVLRIYGVAIILSLLLFFVYHIMKLGSETSTRYEISLGAAYFSSILLVLAFAFLWLIMGILAGLSGWALGHLIADGIAEWLAFLLFLVMAYFTYSPMIRFKTTILEKWLGWQRKDVIVNG